MAFNHKFRWNDRLRRETQSKGWSWVELARRSGVPKESIYKYARAKGRMVEQPRGNAINKLADALGVTSLWLRDGLGQKYSRLGVEGYTGAGEVVIPLNEEDVDSLDVDFDAPELFAVQVRGNSMQPVYRNGDYLVCSRLRGADIASVLGHDCVVRTEEGESYIKRVVRGNARGTFTLMSYGGDTIADRRLAWVAPVIWIKRAI